MVDIERRFAAQPAELRADPQTRTLEWYPAVFGVLSSEMMGFRERLQRGCFSKSLQEQDIHALINHDANLVIGRNKAGSLELRENAKGLFAKVKLPNTTAANDLLENVRAGNIDGGSFAFTVVGKGEKWLTERGEVVREVLEAKLYDVSVVTLGAYPQAGNVVAHGAQLAALETRHQLMGPPPSTLPRRTEVQVVDLADRRRRSEFPRVIPSLAEARRELEDLERQMNERPAVPVSARSATATIRRAPTEEAPYRPLPVGLRLFSPNGPNSSPISNEYSALAAGVKVVDPPAPETRIENQSRPRFWFLGGK